MRKYLLGLEASIDERKYMVPTRYYRFGRPKGPQIPDYIKVMTACVLCIHRIIATLEIYNYYILSNGFSSG